MITALVRFALSTPMSAESAAERFTSSASKYQDLPGLERKHFLRSEDGTSAGGIYFWESREAAEAFYTNDWRAGIEARFGSAPTVDFFEVPVTVDADKVTVPGTWR